MSIKTIFIFIFHIFSFLILLIIKAVNRGMDGKRKSGKKNYLIT